MSGPGPGNPGSGRLSCHNAYWALKYTKTC